mmetsp:Transcript_112521/g.157798  ORF Transcript_112521/g.157798 Transcript_112521/m.157798 type:complete len:91 (+) Transcript_112521:199-471(+)
MGIYPYSEDKLIKGFDLYELLQTNPKKFWEIHGGFMNEGNVAPVQSSFKKLFESMTLKNPQNRATISDIKASEWFRGPVYTDSELASMEF